MRANQQDRAADKRTCAMAADPTITVEPTAVPRTGSSPANLAGAAEDQFNKMKLSLTAVLDTARDAVDSARAKAGDAVDSARAGATAPPLCVSRKPRSPDERSKAEAEAKTVAVERQGVVRMLIFWKLIGPMILQYRPARDMPKGAERDAALDRLNLKYAPLVLATILELRGLYVKLGQAVSIAPMAPEPYREELKVLQNGMPPKPAAEIRRLIERGLGRPWHQMFRSIDFKPVGAASIGQVHRAELLDGRQVVIKIQYAEVKASFVSDLASLRRAAGMWSSSLQGEVKELCTHFMAELSFERECAAHSGARFNPSAALTRLRPAHVATGRR